MRVYRVNVKGNTRPQNTYLEIILFNKSSSSLNIFDCDLVLNYFIFPCRLYLHYFLDHHFDAPEFNFTFLNLYSYK